MPPKRDAMRGGGIEDQTRRPTQGTGPAGSVAGGSMGGSPSDRAPITRRGLVPRPSLDDHAVFVVRRLRQSGHDAYLVGGCVRDLLVGLEPKDFDVATDARPNRVRRLFRSARVIGRRFRLVHILFPGGDVIEVSTFRGDPAQHDGQETAAPTPEDVVPELPVPAPKEPAPSPERSGRSRRHWTESNENVFGTAEQDAFRRDFTINALYYDPIEDAVLDWVGGLEDLDRGLIRCIGDPRVRIHEDPVRMLRAAHFAERMSFRLDGALDAAIRDHAATIRTASNARLYVELIKLLTRGRASGTFRALQNLGILAAWLPSLSAALDEEADWPAEGGGTHEEASRGQPEVLPTGHATWSLLGAADSWGLRDRKAPEALALACLFGPYLLAEARRENASSPQKFARAFETCFRPIALDLCIPRHVVGALRETVGLLNDLRHPPVGRRLHAVLHRRAFPLSLALLRLDLMARRADSGLVDAWTEEARAARVSLEFPGPLPVPRLRRGKSTLRRGRSRRRKPGRSRAALGPEAGAWVPPPPPA